MLHSGALRKPRALIIYVPSHCLFFLFVMHAFLLYLLLSLCFFSSFFFFFYCCFFFFFFKCLFSCSSATCCILTVRKLGFHTRVQGFEWRRWSMCVLDTSCQTVEFNCTTGYCSILWCHDTTDLRIIVLALLCFYVLTECCSVPF